jgi:hypothetical protein
MMSRGPTSSNAGFCLALRPAGVLSPRFVAAAVFKGTAVLCFAVGGPLVT